MLGAVIVLQALKSAGLQSNSTAPYVHVAAPPVIATFRAPIFYPVIETWTILGAYYLLRRSYGRAAFIAGVVAYAGFAHYPWRATWTLPVMFGFAVMARRYDIWRQSVGAGPAFWEQCSFTHG